MGSKNKLKRFQENVTLPNVIQPTRESLVKGSFVHKGHWKEYFANDNPIITELEFVGISVKNRGLSADALSV